MTSTILITGGTGTLGRHVVSILRETGRRVRVLSRSEQSADDGIEQVTGDISTGVGVDAAVAGVHTIVHCAGSNSGDGEKARHLVRAAAAAGVRHLVNISVVGADRIPVVSPIDRAAYGYFASKRKAELVIENSGIGYSTLRATQFHDFALMILEQMAKLPVLPLWKGASFQPVDAHEVAEQLVDLALHEPAGLVGDIAGPRVYAMDRLARDYLDASGKRRLIMNVPVPGRAARAFRAGANLAPDRAIGHRTWEEFLAQRFQHAEAAQT